MKKVLILCTGNSARSLMAEYLVNRELGQQWQAESAGVEPSRPNPWAIRVLEELGIDAGGARSKSVEEFLERDDLDLVVTVCDHARETCPVFPHPVKQIHMGFEDPAPYSNEPEDIALAKFREVRDLIRNQLLPVLEQFISD
ncbi:MAG: arsenate reductase ArsC [bacterium]